MEGDKPQDFSFFHRSEKLVQQIKERRIRHYDTLKTLLSLDLLDEDIHLQDDLWQAINDAYELLFPLWFSSCYRVVGGGIYWQ